MPAAACNYFFFPLFLSTQALGCIACQFDPYSRPGFDMIVAELAPVVDSILEKERAGDVLPALVGQLRSFTAVWGGVLSRAIYGQKTAS